MSSSNVSQKSKDEHVNTDVYLEILIYLSEMFSMPKSAQSLRAGLAYDAAGMDAKQFCEAASTNKIKAQIGRKTDLSKLSKAVLPCVLILKGNHPCILLGFEDAKNTVAKLYIPETKTVRDMPLNQVVEDFTGYVIYVHPKSSSGSIDNSTGLSDVAPGRHWYWSIIKKSTSIYALAIIASLFINLFALVSPLFIMIIYDRVIPNAAIETGWALGLGAIVAFGFDFIFRTIRGYLIDFASRKSDVIAARRIYDHLLGMRLGDRPSSSGAFANILKDFDSVRDFFTSATITALVDLPFSLLFLFFVYQLGGHIALVLIGLILLVVIVGFMVQASLKHLVANAQKSAQTRHGLLVETINGLETIKSAQGDGAFRKKYTAHLQDDAVYAQKSRMISAFGVNFATFLQQIASVIIILNGMYLVQDNIMSVGGLIACVILGGRAIAPIGQIANLMTRYHQANNALVTLDSIMSGDVERPAGRDFLNRPNLDGDIRFDHVHFSYPQSDQVKVLRDVSFSVSPGEKVGVIGRVGSGKSTIAKLMLKLYEPTDGAIFADDTDIRQIDPADLRANIGYISQDITLFQGTIRENIAMSVPAASDEMILECAEAAGVHDFVSRHPMGYDALVGEGGSALSGGQRQAIALARAMLKNPNIILCDEPTNAMDVQSENAFCNFIRKQAKDKTLVLITHKHAMLSLVDRLILVHEGKVIMDDRRDNVIEALQSGAVKIESASS